MPLKFTLTNIITEPTRRSLDVMFAKSLMDTREAYNIILIMETAHPKAEKEKLEICTSDQ